MFTVDGFFYNAWFSDGLSLKHVQAGRMKCVLKIEYKDV